MTLRNKSSSYEDFTNTQLIDTNNIKARDNFFWIVYRTVLHGSHIDKNIILQQFIILVLLDLKKEK